MRNKRKMDCKKRIDEISCIVQDVMKTVVKGLELDSQEYLAGIPFLENIIPTPFNIAELYGIRYEFRELDEDVPSCLLKKEMLICISNKYYNNKLAIRNLLAHELGHFFLHDRPLTEINEFPSKTEEEYEANIFSIFLLPQIVGGEEWKDWEKWEPKELNSKLYRSYLKKMNSN